MRDLGHSRAREAADVLRANDRGGYTVPTAGLYPFQWNWDAGFIALGWAVIDEARAWLELEKLFEGQWADGLVPHIVFHHFSSDYFPGPEVWGVDHHPSTSGLSQPPVLATVVRKLLDGARDRSAAADKARDLYPRLLAFHRWWVRARDPDRTGLVAVLHPWETGMDNSPAWDAALARVPVPVGLTYSRRDTRHVDGAQRPRQAEYDRYIALVQLFRGVRYDPAAMFSQSPFRVADVGVNAILHRSCRDLLALAGRFGDEVERHELSERLETATTGFARLWNRERRLYQPFDLVAGRLIDVATSAGFLPLYALVPDAGTAASMAAEIVRWGERAAYLVPSNCPEAATFEPSRYWRGPVWANVNWMLAEGLVAYDLHDLAARLRRDIGRLIETAGFFEYFDPIRGEGFGGDRFSWTAAAALAWLWPPEDRAA